MTTYTYKIDEETGLIRKDIKETYPDLNILDRGLDGKRSTALIKKQYDKALQGKAEEPIVIIEEKWFATQQKIESLIKEKKDLEDKLNGVEEVVDEETGEVITEAVEKETDETKIESMKERLEVISGKEESYFTDEGKLRYKTVPGELQDTIDEREKMEEKDEFLKAYRGVETDAVRPVPVIQKISKEKTKALIAHERDLRVRNAEDSIADIAKMVSLSFSVVAVLWNFLSDDDKSKLPSEQKDLIDYAVLKFSQLDTRADDQLKEEGAKLVDKLFERENEIAKIVKEVKAD